MDGAIVKWIARGLIRGDLGRFVFVEDDETGIVTDQSVSASPRTL
jgi:hypothetical protein